MQGKIYSVGNELSRAPNKLINISGRDEQALGFFCVGECGRIDNSRHADRADGDTESVGIERRTVITDA